MIRKVRNITSSSTLEIGDDIIQVSTSGGAVTLTLPTAGLNKKKQWRIKDDGSAGSNNVTISGAGSETIDGASSYTLNVNYASIDIYPNQARTAWLVS